MKTYLPTNDWRDILKTEFEKPYFKKLLKELDNLYKSKEIYPAKKDVFNAFKLSNFEDTRVVILGQDPYHNPGQAHGLAFSVQYPNKQPPSLKNIFKELHNDLGVTPPQDTNGDLSKWAQQGVLLMNTTLTVEKNKPTSHSSLGWTIFTDAVIEKLNGKTTPVVFLLWGNHAKTKKELITNNNHLVLTSAHPSPFSADRFFGNKHFSKTNKFLEHSNQKQINWQI